MNAEREVKSGVSVLDVSETNFGVSFQRFHARLETNGNQRMQQMEPAPSGLPINC